MQDRSVLRREKTMKVDQSLTTFMNDSIQSPLNLIDSRLSEFVNTIEKDLLKLIIVLTN